MDGKEIGMVARPASGKGPAADRLERPLRRVRVPRAQAKNPPPQLDEESSPGAHEALPHPVPGRGAGHAMSRPR